MPTAQARLTRTRGLHATRSSIRSDNDTSSLPERRIACRFFFSRWHRAHTCHPPTFQDSDLRRPIAASFPGAYDLRALSWAHMRAWGAAGSCHTPPQRSISRIKHDLHSRNAQSAHSPAKPACRSRTQRLPRRAHVPMIGRAGHTRLGSTPSVGGGRCPEI